MDNKEWKKLLHENTLITEGNEYCHVWKANDNKWYVDLSPRNKSKLKDAYTYGSFKSEDDAINFLQRTNIDGWSTDKFGKEMPPKKSPNGKPVQSPQPAPATPIGW